MDSEIAEAGRVRFSIDRRALAAFRVTLAAAIIVDLGMRARDLRAFYTDDGVLPRSTLAELFPALARYSLHAVSGGVVAQAALFSLTALAAVALLAGYRSRAAAFVTFVLVASMHARNPFVLNGGDTMLLVLLLFAAALPVGSRWSFDAVRRDAGSDPVFSAAGVTALLFLVVIYSSNAVLRYRGELWMNGDAVRVVFELETLTVLLGPYLAELPAVLVAINWAWVAMLTAAPLLIFLGGWLRALFAASFVAAHVGMALTLRLGVFPVVVIAALLLYFPPVFWDRLEAVVPTESVGSFAARFTGGRRVGISDSVFTHITRAAGVVAVVVLLVVVLWQGAALGYIDVPDGDTDANPEEYAWKMFAPEPLQWEGWYVVPVGRADGDRVDGFHGGSVETDPPPDLADAYPTTHWDRYLSETRYSSEVQRRALADYFCGTVEEAETVELVYFERDTVLDGEAETERVELLTHDCNAS